MSVLLSAEKVYFSYYKGVYILKNFNFSLRAGDFCSLIGPSGAGKTTIFRILTGFREVDRGIVKLKGKDLHGMPEKKRAGIIATLQQSAYTPVPFTVRQIVEMGRISSLSRFALFSRDDRNIVDSAMEQMEIIGYADSLYNNLSGGERQRVRLAMALAQQPEILLLDEPTSSLDIGHAFRLMNLLRQLNGKNGITVMIISHDIQLACRYSERMVLVRDGSVMADGTPENIIRHELIEDTYRCKVKIHRDEDGRFMIATA
jgi:iron complex transport system ATP-binding protein